MYQHLQQNGSVAPFCIETGDNWLPLLLCEDHGDHAEQGEEDHQAPHLKPGHHDQTCPLNIEQNFTIKIFSFLFAIEVLQYMPYVITFVMFFRQQFYIDFKL